MSNLLDKASIILTPTAYNNGEALCVKPSDGSGDFDFSRNSAATRVNAQGLVENVQILSSNLVQNGDFSEEGAEEVSNGSFSQEGSEVVVNGDFSSDTDWTKVNATISGGTGDLDSTSGASLLFQQNALTVGKTYKAILDVTNYNSLGTCALINSNGDIQFEITSNGNKEFYFTQGGTSSNLTFRAVSGGIFSIDNVSVREVGQDWSLGAGWSIGEDKAVATNAPSGQSVGQNAVASQIPNGTTVKVSFEVTSISLGFFGIYFSGSLVGTLNSVGVGTFYFVKGTETSFYIRALGTTSGSITNISVKEVGQNWTLGSGWSIGNGVATCDGSANFSDLTQLNNNITIGKNYKITYTVSDYVSGSFKFIMNSNTTAGLERNADGTYTDYLTSAAPAYSFRTQGSGFTGSVTNISVIEITDDTNLPRINYENFSYQDALGSELVVNGGFDTDTAWSKGTGWSIGDGAANANNVPNLQRLQNTGNAPSIIGSTYKYSIDVSNVSGFYSVYVFGVYVLATVSTEGTIEGYVTATSTNGAIFVAAASAGGLISATIDNVSVKEVTGQEVVPDSGCGSWLFESQSTNLVTQSELLNGYWSNSGSTNLISDVISPDGISFSKKVTTTSAGNFKGLLKNESVIWDSKTFTISTFAKKGNTDWLYFYNIGSNNGNNGVWFNLDSGLIGSIGAAWSNVKIETFTNGWYRCSATLSFGAATNYLYILNSDVNNSVFSTLDNYAYIWGTQIEENNISSYIPTEGSTVTRNQDVCNNGGSLATINSTEGVLYAEIAALANDGTNREISINNGTTNDRIQILLAPASNELLIFYKAQSGATQFIMSETLADATQFNKIAFKWKANDFALWVNGTERATISSGVTSNVGVLTKIDFDQFNGGTKFYGKTKALAVWKEALTDAELTELTTI